MSRRVLATSFLAAACASAVCGLSPVPAAAADGLIVTSDTRYEVQLESGQITAAIDERSRRRGGAAIGALLAVDLLAMGAALTLRRRRTLASPASPAG